MNRFLYALLPCLLLTAVPTSGQTRPPKLAVSATVAPMYARTTYNRRFLYPESDGQIVEPVYLDGSRVSTGYAAGITFRYTYAPGWSVGTGVWYQQLTIRQARPAAVGEGTTLLRNRAIRVPLLLNYQSATRRLSPYYSLGVVLDFPMLARIAVTSPGQPTQHLRLRSDGGPVFHALIGAGAAYQLDRRCSLLVQPVATYNLGRFGGALTNLRSIEAGLLTQLSYAF